MEKKLKILQGSRSMLAYFARTLNDPEERLIVWKMHKEKHFLGRENTSAILRDASKVDTRTYILLSLLGIQ